MTNRREGESMSAWSDDSVADVEALCGPRRSDVTEIFGPNAWYGAASTIREYCGWPKERPLPIMVPHGVVLSAEEVCPLEARSALPAVYSFPAYRDQVYRDRLGKVVVAGCSPWLYLEPAAIRRQADTRSYILIMPAHSSLIATAVLDHSRLVRTIEETYRGEELRCCMYWRDVQLGRHVHYTEREIQVNSAGHIYDPAFFSRLARLLAGAKLMVTNEFGTHVFYAASHNVPVVVMDDIDVVWFEPHDTMPRRYDCSQNARIFLEVEALFRRPSPDVGRQRDAAEMMMGYERKLSAGDLRSLLEELWQLPAFRYRAFLPWKMVVAPARTIFRRISH